MFTANVLNPFGPIGPSVSSLGDTQRRRCFMPFFCELHYCVLFEVHVRFKFCQVFSYLLIFSIPNDKKMLFLIFGDPFIQVIPQRSYLYWSSKWYGQNISLIQPFPLFHKFCRNIRLSVVIRPVYNALNRMPADSWSAKCHGLHRAPADI